MLLVVVAVVVTVAVVGKVVVAVGLKRRQPRTAQLPVACCIAERKRRWCGLAPTGIVLLTISISPTLPLQNIAPYIPQETRGLGNVVH